MLGDPFPIQYYIGCGHLLRRTQFLELGGYLERLHYYSEENQFCLDALLGGYSTYAYPAVAVRHNRTPAARNSAKATRYYVRNQAILGFLYFPFPYSILRALNCLSLLRDPEWNDHPGRLLLGWMEAFVCAFRWRKLRSSPVHCTVSRLEEASGAQTMKKATNSCKAMKGLPFWFMPVWCTLMPLTSFLLIRSAQGTIPAYMLALISPLFVILSRDEGTSNGQKTRYFKIASLVAGIWVLASLRQPIGTNHLQPARLWRHATD